MLEIVENLRAVGTPLQTLLVTALPRPSSCPLPRNPISAFSRSVVPSVISGLHHYECVAPLVANSLQSGRFWARSTASVHDSPWESRSFCTVLMQVIHSRPGGLFQYTEGKESTWSQGPPNESSWPHSCCICTRVFGCVCVCQALSATDLNAVLSLCSAAQPCTVLGQGISSCPLRQPVLLSLIQQLSVDLTSNTSLKLQ